MCRAISAEVSETELNLSSSRIEYLSSILIDRITPNACNKSLSDLNCANYDIFNELKRHFVYLTIIAFTTVSALSYHNHIICYGAPYP